MKLKTTVDGVMIGRLLITSPVTPDKPLTLQPILNLHMQRGDEVFQWTASAWPDTFEIQPDPNGTGTLTDPVVETTWVTHAVFPSIGTTTSLSTADADDRRYKIERFSNGTGTQVGWLWVARTGTTIDAIHWYNTVLGDLFVIQGTDFLRFTAAPTGPFPTSAREIAQTPKPARQ